MRVLAEFAKVNSREMLQKSSTAKVYSGKKNRFFHNFNLIEENYSEPKEETILGSFLAPTTDEIIEASK